MSLSAAMRKPGRRLGETSSKRYSSRLPWPGKGFRVWRQGRGDENGMTATVAEAVGHPPDHDLVAAIRDGDDRAFEQLYTRYHARIAAYVRGMVKDHGRAEDVTQEVFFSALRRMRETERPIAFKPWIYEIARNACIDLFRRTSRAEELSYDADGGLPSDDYRHLISRGPTPDAAVDAKQQLDHLRGAFGGLSETHHQILVLRELEGLSYREIGERLGMSRPAVESTLFRARRRLTEEYDELVTGRRCVRVQAIINEAAEGMLGARDSRRLARHLSYCQPCRRHARLLGVETAPARSVAGKLAALIPFPAFLRRRLFGEGEPFGGAPADGGAASSGSGGSSATGTPRVDIPGTAGASTPSAPSLPPVQPPSVPSGTGTSAPNTGTPSAPNVEVKAPTGAPSVPSIPSVPSTPSAPSAPKTVGGLRP